MKFICDSCSTKYSIADERVRGRVLKIRCKKCDFVITVREDVQAAAASLQLPDDDEFGRALDAIGGGEKNDQTAIGSLDGSTGNITGNIKGAAEADDWYVSFDGEQEGPFSLERAIERVKLEAKTDKEAHAWRPGFLVWLPVEEVPELAAALFAKKPALPPRIPVQAMAAAPVGGASAFGGGRGAVGAQIAKDPSGPRAALSINAGAGAMNAGAMSGGSAPVGGSARASDLFSQVPAPMFNPGSAPPLPSSHADLSDGAPDLPISNEASGLVNLAQLGAAAFGKATGPAFVNGHTGRARAIPAPSGRHPALGEPMSALENLPATASNSGPVVVVAGAAQGGGSSPIFKWLAVLGLLATGGLGFGMWWVYTHRPAAETIIVTEPSRHVDDSPITVTDPVTGKVTVIEPKKGTTGGKKIAAKTTVPVPPVPGQKADPNISGSQKALQDLYRDGVEHTPHDVGAQNRAGGAGTQVSQASIMAAVTANKRSLNLCFDRALKHDSSMKSGRVPIQVTVGISGRVTAVNIPEAQYASSELGQCFIAAVKKWSFPSSDATYTTEFPFILQGQ